MSDISASDIESYTILKDASSTAIYGSRGAYGVIIITTKSGSKNGKMSVNYNVFYGTKNIWYSFYKGKKEILIIPSFFFF